MSSNRHQRGFTLVELFVVMAVAGIIALIAIPAYRGYISTAHTTECWNNLAAIKLAEEEHFLENQEYFYGANYSELQVNSGSLWTLAEANPADAQCEYAVTGAGNVWTATATGKGAKVADSWTKTLSND